jgi:hypothetical protein
VIVHWKKFKEVLASGFLPGLPGFLLVSAFFCISQKFFALVRQSLAQGLQL